MIDHISICIHSESKEMASDDYYVAESERIDSVGYLKGNNEEIPNHHSSDMLKDVCLTGGVAAMKFTDSF